MGHLSLTMILKPSHKPADFPLAKSCLKLFVRLQPQRPREVKGTTRLHNGQNLRNKNKLSWAQDHGPGALSKLHLSQ